MQWVMVAGFVVAVLPLALTPGASFTLATQRTLDGQQHATPWVIAGTATGIYTHALLAAAGLSALVMRSSQAFTAVKIVGGLYLVALGLATIWQTRKNRALRTASAAKRLPWAGLHNYPQAVLANVLNPKAASVYLTLAPQFLIAQQVGVISLLTLASAHVLVMAGWLTAWTILLRRGRRITQSGRFKTTVNRAGGAILVALGIRTTTN